MRRATVQLAGDIALAGRARASDVAATSAARRRYFIVRTPRLKSSVSRNTHPQRRTLRHAAQCVAKYKYGDPLSGDSLLGDSYVDDEGARKPPPLVPQKVIVNMNREVVRSFVYAVVVPCVRRSHAQMVTGPLRQWPVTHVG